MIITTGFAMFSMFFGAGNVVFPLSLGLFAEDQNIFAILGLLITAVGVPFLGLMAMTLFDGDYKKFFGRMGGKTGFLIALVIMGLIGPFGAIPRCIALSYSTTQLFVPWLDIKWFSIASCLIIFACTIKQSSIVDLLGKILTPLLLLALGIIIIKGVLTSPPPLPSSETALTIFLTGLREGYQTMDLLGAFFFSSVVIMCLKKDLEKSSYTNKEIIIQTLKSSLVGAFLLALIYIGFSYVSSFNSGILSDIAQDQLLGFIAIQILGPYAGLVACMAVALACLTTAIALAAVSAEFIHKDLAFNRISYGVALTVTLVISYFVSTLNFTGIVRILAPILEVCYPSLILLTIFNLLYKLYKVETVKGPVLTLFFLSLGGYLWSYFT